jgi:hypothetical protein
MSVTYVTINCTADIKTRDKYLLKIKLKVGAGYSYIMQLGVERQTRPNRNRFLPECASRPANLRTSLMVGMITDRPHSWMQIQKSQTNIL